MKLRICYLAGEGIPTLLFTPEFSVDGGVTPCDMVAGKTVLNPIKNSCPALPQLEYGFTLMNQSRNPLVLRSAVFSDYPDGCLATTIDGVVYDEKDLPIDAEIVLKVVKNNFLAFSDNAKLRQFLTFIQGIDQKMDVFHVAFSDYGWELFVPLFRQEMRDYLAHCIGVGAFSSGAEAVLKNFSDTKLSRESQSYGVTSEDISLCMKALAKDVPSQYFAKLFCIEKALMGLLNYLVPLDGKRYSDGYVYLSDDGNFVNVSAQKVESFLTKGSFGD